jgi:hypothetical protein
MNVHFMTVVVNQKFKKNCLPSLTIWFWTSPIEEGKAGAVAIGDRILIRHR